MTQPSPSPTQEQLTPPSGEVTVNTLAAIEVALAAAVLAAYLLLLAAIKRALFGGVDDTSRFNLSNLWSTQPLWNEQVDALMPQLLAVAKQGWDDTMSDLGLGIAFDPDDPTVQDQMQRTRNLLVRTPDDIYREIVYTLQQGVDAGDTQAQLADRINDVLDINGHENWPARADAVGVTEVNRAYEFGSFAAANEVQQLTGDAGMTKTWDAKRDSKTRVAHRDANGQTRLLSQPFDVGGFPMMAPLDPAAPAHLVVNCVPGTAVINASGLQKTFRYAYTGSMLTISGERGHVTTVSPNHPVLTEAGWVRACQLQKGDNLICADDLGMRLGDPDVEGSPATAEQIYDASLLVGASQRVVGLLVDFHGDRVDSDIDVVDVGGELSFGVDATLLESFNELCLACADAPAASGSSLAHLLASSRNTSRGKVSFNNLVAALGLRHALPLQSLSLTAISNLDPSFFEPVDQDRSRDTADSGESLHGLSSPVSFDKIIEIGWHDFAGHLYTFETASHVYIADGIVSHNCRCRMKIRRGRR